MFDKLFDVVIHYTLDGEMHNDEVQLYAKDKRCAKEIAEELFYVSTGIILDMHVTVKYAKVSKEDSQMAICMAKMTYEQLAVVCNGKSYKRFIELYKDLGGTNITLKTSKKYEVVQNRTRFIVEFKDSVMNINKDEIQVYIGSSSKSCIVCDDFTNVYVGG